MTGESAMVDLIVPTGTVLKINQSSQVEPQYCLLRAEANAKIVASIDLTIKASRAEFAEGCVIDARGATGSSGSDGTGVVQPSVFAGDLVSNVPVHGFTVVSNVLVRGFTVVVHGSPLLSGAHFR
jgi:hypothetical protein